MTKKKMYKILFVSSEVSPFAKVGGLADVAASLPKALAFLNHDIRVVMPKYASVDLDLKYVTDFPVYIQGAKKECIIREAKIPISQGIKNKELQMYFVDNYYYFDRPNVYAYDDDAHRFTFFCKAVLEMLTKINFKPDIIHCNDWETGPICMLLDERYRYDAFYKNIATVYTIHNLQYQGVFDKGILYEFNVDASVFNSEKVEFHGSFNFAKAGLVYADKINTVSKKYCEEIKTFELGENLDGLLRKRADDCIGIVNGLNCEEYDPLCDTNICKNYGIDDFWLKKENKYNLQREMNLPVRDVAIISMITRLTGQKGIDLVLTEIHNILNQDVQFILIGSGDQFYENEFKKISDMYPDKVAAYIGYNGVLAQKVYSGSDIFLMPSKFEPCGLSQIISLRYGTVPIVRETGGLSDTIIDIDRDYEHGNGFVFKEYSSVDMMNTIYRALNVFNYNKERWDILVKRGITSTFSWDESALKYVELYKWAIEKRLAKQ